MALVHTKVSNVEFLAAVFGKDRLKAYVTGFTQDPTEAKTAKAKGRMWGGNELRAGGASRIQRAVERKLNTFVTISVFRPDDEGRVRRRKSLHQATHLIVADDIAAGDEPGSGSKWANNGILDVVYGLLPSYILETSPGNTQWGWILAEPETRGWLVDRIQDRMIELGLSPDAKDPGMRGVTRYVRLPEGWNTKAKYGEDGGFRCGMLEWHPETKYTTEEIARALEVDTNEPAPRRVPERVDLDEEDPVLGYLADEGMLKGPIPGKPGAWDVLCPWADEHSERDDSGAAYFQAGYIEPGTGTQYLQGGFKCHHGHCETRGRRSLVGWLSEKGHGVAEVLDAFADMVEEKVEPSRINAREEYQERLAAAATETELKKICREIRGDKRVDRLAHEVLIRHVRRALRTVCADTVPLDLARKLLNGKLDNGGGKKDKPAGKPPKWLRDWVYCSETDTFHNKRRRETCSHRAFNSLLCSEIGDDMPPPDIWALEQKLIPKLRGLRYLPGEGETYEHPESGSMFLNTYRAPPPPKLREDWSVADCAAVEAFTCHLRTMIPDRRERRLFWSWLCFKVRSPGARVSWAVLMCGTTGDGKSLFTELMRLVLGDANVSEINGIALESRFNSWAEGSALVAVEEVRHIGHNRHDVFNALKPLISNRHVSIERKGENSYVVENKTGYLAYSNYLSALPLTDEDRRVFLVRLRFESKDDLTAMEAAAGGHDKYWNPVFASFREHADAFRGWMTEFELDDEFDPHGNAPWTAAKAEAIHLAENDATGLIRDVLASGGRGIAEHLVSTRHLSRVMEEEYGRDVGPVALNRTLADDGWYKLSFQEKSETTKRNRQQIRWDAKQTNIWARKESGFPRRGVSDKERVLKMLDATSDVKAEDFDDLS